MTRRASRLILYVFAAIGVMLTMTDSALASRKARPVIALHCVSSDAPHADALCNAVERALRQLGSGHVIRRLDADETRPNRPEDRVAELHITCWSKIGMSARLDWKQGAERGMRDGQELSFTVSDAQIRPSMLERFARNLLSQTQNLHIPAPE